MNIIDESELENRVQKFFSTINFKQKTFFYLKGEKKLNSSWKNFVHH